MGRIHTYHWAAAIRILGIALVLAPGCGGGGGGGGNPSVPVIQGTVVEIDTGTAIEDARVVLIDTNTDTQYGDTLVTDSSGNFLVQVPAGQYSLHVTAQGYMDRPWKNFTPTTVDLAAGETEAITVEMIPYDDTSQLGSISGQVLDGDGNAVSGMLVVAVSGNSGYSTFNEADGSYIIFNVPAGTYDIQAHRSGYNSTEQTGVAVTAEIETQVVDLQAANDALAGVSGQVTFLASPNSVVDVTMVHPATGESIPGLQTTIDSQNLTYSISGVPDGTYHAFASFKNDGYVLDPDWVFKFGIPVLNMAGADVELDFSVTGAVPLVSPTNATETITPLDVSYAGVESDLVFEWTSYAASTAGYVIEVSDILGNVVWGGFAGDGNRNITIDPDTTSAAYNSDGNASELSVGTTYQWKIYALKNDNAEPNGFKIISASEDLLGLIRLVEEPIDKAE